MTITSATVLPDSIYEQLRRSIIAQEDEPGSPLTESAVALRFGVARPTAKIAIERLVGEGLLRREAHRAARVPELGRDDIIDLFENRAIVETAAIAALARRGTIPDAALTAHRALQDRATRGTGFAEEDIAFHRALVTGQQSPRLTRMHELLMGEIELCIGQVQAHHLIQARDVARQHQRILDSITAGHADTAALLTREHIDGTRQRLVAHYDSTH